MAHRAAGDTVVGGFRRMAVGLTFFSCFLRGHWEAEPVGQPRGSHGALASCLGGALHRVISAAHTSGETEGCYQLGFGPCRQTLRSALESRS